MTSQSHYVMLVVILEYMLPIPIHANCAHSFSFLLFPGFSEFYQSCLMIAGLLLLCPSLCTYNRHPLDTFHPEHQECVCKLVAQLKLQLVSSKAALLF